MTLSQSEILDIWSRGVILFGFDPREWRADAYSNLIRFQDFGDASSRYGWSVEPSSSCAMGGDETAKPLHWRLSGEDAPVVTAPAALRSAPVEVARVYR